MTNFIYNMQEELFHLNMILPVGEFSPIKKLVDHIEAQGKQLRELNMTIETKNKTIEKYECEKKELQNSNNYLGKKVNALNQGIRDSEDLTWKQKYDALLQSSEQAISALQKKCVNIKYGVASESRIRDGYISELENEVAGLKKENKELKESNAKLLVQDRVRDGVISLSSDLNTKIDNQRKEITHLLKAQEKLKAEIANKEQIISSLNANRAQLERKVRELNEGIHNSDDLKWKDKYEALKLSSNQAIAALQKKCSDLSKKQVSDLIKPRNKRSFFGESFDMYSIYDLNRLEEVIADKIKSYDSKLYSLMAERDKYKESSEEYRLKLLVAERNRDECNKAAETLSKIHDLIHRKE